MKKLSFSALFLALSVLPFLLAMQGCDKKIPYIPEPEVIHVQGITVSASSAELTVDEDAKLTVNITPSNATDKGVKFTSDNPLVQKP